MVLLINLADTSLLLLKYLFCRVCVFTSFTWVREIAASPTTWKKENIWHKGKAFECEMIAKWLLYKVILRDWLWDRIGCEDTFVSLCTIRRMQMAFSYCIAQSNQYILYNPLGVQSTLSLFSLPGLPRKDGTTRTWRGGWTTGRYTSQYITAPVRFHLLTYPVSVVRVGS